MDQPLFSRKHSLFKAISFVALCCWGLSAEAQEPENAVRIDTMPRFSIPLPAPEFERLSGMNLNSHLIDPSWKEDPVDAHAVSFRYQYQAVYPAVFFRPQAPIHKGEFQVKGPIYQWENNLVSGFGSQENLLGIGQLNTAGLIFTQQVSDRFSWQMQLYTQKFSAPHQFSQLIGAAVRTNYQLSDKLAMHLLGGYSSNVEHRSVNYNFGASLSYDATERWGIEMGANHYYDNFSKRWETVPIIIPYYRLNKDTKLGIDFGPIVKEVIIQNRQRGNRNPTIPPPIPGFR